MRGDRSRNQLATTAKDRPTKLTNGSRPGQHTVRPDFAESHTVRSPASSPWNHGGGKPPRRTYRFQRKTAFAITLSAGIPPRGTGIILGTL